MMIAMSDRPQMGMRMDALSSVKLRPTSSRKRDQKYLTVIESLQVDEIPE
eukprot:TRINITY_DN1508_c0_g1_i1.p1 TRINITY_DN1508_c0_g1~~TRINITY_DN1508_c0_g1_i1.p1  ORF type:complete len:58 (-),score=9.67 TRINITY_DN1508_c0_g1_i1:275-424(-)